jgi:hypothetical protein
MSGWKPDICVYHGGCDDGFGAALAVHMRWGNDVVYVPGAYGGFEWPRDMDGKRILFVDFSLKQAQMRELVNGGIVGVRPHSVVVLDHHKTAEAELFPWSIGGKDGPPVDLRGKRTGKSALGRIDELLAMNEMENVEPIVAFFDMHKSGARMAWEFCHSGYDVPRLIEYVEDRDLWRFAIAETKAVSAALRTYPHDFDIWSGFLSDTSRLVTEGGVVLRGHEKNVGEFIKNRYWTEVGGVKVPVVNVPYHYASDCADAMLKAEPDAPFCASWFKRRDGRIQFSLRSRDDRMDVSEIAKQYGGGGHRNAAGFEMAA